MTNSNTKIEGIVFLRSYYESIEELEDLDKLEIYDAIFGYAFKNKTPEFSKKYLTGYWKLIIRNLDSSIDRYKASQENGKKGGRKPNEVKQVHPKETTPESKVFIESNATNLRPEVNGDEVDLEIVNLNQNETESIPQSKDENIIDFSNNNSTLEINPIQEVQNDEKYEIEIDAFKDTISSASYIESFVEQLNGAEPNYIKAKVIFDENDSFIDDVVLATENDVKPKYINRFEIENEIKKRNKNGESLP